MLEKLFLCKRKSFKYGRTTYFVIFSPTLLTLPLDTSLSYPVFERLFTSGMKISWLYRPKLILGRSFETSFVQGMPSHPTTHIRFVVKLSDRVSQEQAISGRLQQELKETGIREAMALGKVDILESKTTHITRELGVREDMRVVNFTPFSKTFLTFN